MLHIILHQSLSYPKIGRPLISHYFDKRDLQRISRTKQHISQVTLPALQRISQVTLPALQRISQAKQHISQVTLPALQRISQAKQRISQVTLPRPLAISAISPIMLLLVLLVQEHCYQSY